jgi:integrase
MGLYRMRGSPYWWMSLVDPQNPKPRRQSTKVHADAPTAKERRELREAAESVYRKAQADLTLGKTGDKKPARRWVDHIDWYSKNVTIHKGGREREEEILDVLRKAWRGQFVQDVTRVAVVEWRTGRRRRVAASTVNREVDVLQHVLAAAVPTYLAESPIVGLSDLRGETTEPGVLSRADEAKILAVLPPADQALVIAALDTLARVSDLLRLRWKDDHGDHFVFHFPKTGRRYESPISSRLRAALDRLPRRGTYIFRHRRKAKKPRQWTHSVKQMFERACEKAGVAYGRGKGVTFHGLRHTGATRLANAKTNLRDIQAIGGWKSMRMLERYLHPSDAQQAAVEGIGEGVFLRLESEPSRDDKSRA